MLWALIDHYIIHKSLKYNVIIYRLNQIFQKETHMWKILILIVTVALFADSFQDSFYVAPILKSTINSMQKEKGPKFAWELYTISSIPTRIFDSLPTLNKGKIACFDDYGGVLWYSGTETGDSSYVVIKTTYGILLNWWKCNSYKKWYLIRTVRYPL